VSGNRRRGGGIPGRVGGRKGEGETLLNGEYIARLGPLTSTETEISVQGQFMYASRVSLSFSLFLLGDKATFMNTMD